MKIRRMRTRLPGTGWLKRLMPKSLLGRSLLMILIPLVALQAVTFQIFYGSHLDIVSRRLSAGIAGEIALTTRLMNRYTSDQDHEWILEQVRDRFDLEISLEPGAKLTGQRRVNVFGPMDDDLEAALNETFVGPFTMDWSSDPRSVLINIQVTDGVLHVVAPRKRLYTTTIYLFVPWVVGTALILFGIAAMFMRIQVRGIRRLARAAEAFGLGRDTPAIRPEGATEVRQAAAAFNRMQDRIRRFLAQRAEMLAGVSHDLRTPLTRLRLALAMLPKDEAWREDVTEMTDDVDEMERMIGGYLAFARGEGTEQAKQVDLAAMLTDVATAARRGGANIEVSVPDSLPVSLRADAVRRAITNLVDNARRHAGRVMLSAVPRGRSVLVNVDDDGPGIAAERREDVFRPFQSGSAGGTGLGLTIARDIVRAHGGDISLEDSPLGGLRARVRLPV
jgi:two-component system, OmpR family, osmolarity sensor histidine kinase EnvZ